MPIASSSPRTDARPRGAPLRAVDVAFTPAGARAADVTVVIDVLRATTLFAGLDDDALRGLSRSCVRRVYGRGQYLWYQGDEGDRLVVVASGLLKVVFTSPGGEEAVLSTPGPYETVGGYILDRIGRVAVVGDSIVVGEHVLRVAETDRYRISRVTLTPQPASSSAAEPAEPSV